MLAIHGCTIGQQSSPRVVCAYSSQKWSFELPLLQNVKIWKAHLECTCYLLLTWSVQFVKDLRISQHFLKNYSQIQFPL